MDEQTADLLRRRFMWDHDAEPNMLTNTLEELRTLQEASDDPEELLNRYQRASAELLDFMDRMRELAVSEAESNGGTIDFSELTVSQIILACVRGYPDIVRAYNGLNHLFNEEMESSRESIRELREQIFETAEHYERIIQGTRQEE